MYHFDISDDPFSWTSENSQVQPQSHIFEISNDQFLHGAYKNCLDLVLEYYFEMFENPFLCPDI